MTDNRDADLMYLLGAAGTALHSELKAKSGSGIVPRYTPTRPHLWDHPAMVVKGDLLGHSLACIPNLMMGQLFDGVELDYVWNHLTTSITNQSAQLRSIVTNFFPSLPLDHLRPASIMARVLALAATRGGKLDLQPRSIILTVDGKEYGIHPNAVINPHRNWRFKRPHVIDMWAAINMVGLPREASLKFRDIEAHTLRFAPALTSHVRTLIGAAAHRGAAFEDQLMDCFDFEGRSADVDADAWSRARDVVAGSSENPLTELRDILRPVIGSVNFQKHFGNASVGTRSYTERQRQKHFEAIEQLEGRLFTSPSGIEPQELAAAQALLKFQQQMGL